jgi:V/A-type H+-transporting ATPase subunit A
MSQERVEQQLQETVTGRVVRVAGAVVAATGLAAAGARLYDVVHVGESRLVGEIIRLSGELATIQVYEDTAGLQVGQPVATTGGPLVVELGPGLLGQVYDGLQRPLVELAARTGDFLMRGVGASALPRERRWPFSPRVRAGQAVGPGDVLGTVPESPTLEHRVLVPPGLSGRVLSIEAGAFTVDETVALIETVDRRQTDGRGRRALGLRQSWPIRRPRPHQGRLDADRPLLTGMRVIDAFFPLARGGAAIIPGGFGTGKTVCEQALARWADADVVVYVGCGERGNEMTEVLEEFPQLEDPRHGGPLMARTVLIANTSNMPVAAREASIYTGITLAEYYRDMGYAVLLLADSTSRWGEALREISGRLEEMPGEEGYPAYLGSRLAEFYERAGRVRCLGGRTEAAPGSDAGADGAGADREGADGAGADRGGADEREAAREGSVTIVGAVSPPGGDFSEPMTQNSLRVAGTFWGLDYDLSRRRHFPAINWTRSYTLYPLGHWYAGAVAPDWNELTREALALLQREAELLEIVQLVGPDALAESQREVLAAARMLREDFLQQQAYDPIDRYCPLAKTEAMLRTVLAFHHAAAAGLQAGVALERLLGLPVVAEIARMKELPVAEAPERLAELRARLAEASASLS